MEALVSLHSTGHQTNTHSSKQRLFTASHPDMSSKEGRRKVPTFSVQSSLHDTMWLPEALKATPHTVEV